VSAEQSFSRNEHGSNYFDTEILNWIRDNPGVMWDSCRSSFLLFARQEQFAQTLLFWEAIIKLPHPAAAYFAVFVWSFCTCTNYPVRLDFMIIVAFEGLKQQQLDVTTESLAERIASHVNYAGISQSVTFNRDRAWITHELNFFFSDLQREVLLIKLQDDNQNERFQLKHKSLDISSNRIAK
jgi:hypothetical protein